MAKLSILAEVKGLGKVVEVYGEFYNNLKYLKEGGAKLISPRNEAYARLQTRGRENIGQNFGTRTSAGLEYAKNQLPILRLNSRLLKPRLAKLSVRANKSGNYFNTNSTRMYEESLKQAERDKNKKPVDRNVILLPSRGPFVMNLEENLETLESILKEQAKPYFEFNGAINFYPVDKDIIDSQNGTLLTGMWFRSIGGKSGLYGSCGRNISKIKRNVRGVLKETLNYF